MGGDYRVERVALHLVDRQLPGPRLAKQEVDLRVFQRSEEVEALQSFFSGHLDKSWAANESRLTVAANFKGMADVRRYYDDLAQDSSRFFQYSCDLAQRLHDVSKGRAAKPGLLMTLLFEKNDDPRKFLALYMMDPGPANKITLLQDEAGAVLLDLAIQRIDHALPDPSDQVLKWAVIPHPTRRAFDVKIRDEVGGSDPAQYFMAFLGCEAQLGEKKQARNLLKTMHKYVEDFHVQEDLDTALFEVAEVLAEEPVLNADVITERIRESQIFDDFDSQAFREVMSEYEIENLSISPNVLRGVKLEYQLPSGISIRGPWAVVESLVQIVTTNGDYEIRIRTPSYRANYV